MYEKIKTVMFGDTEVTIYKNMMGEYFAEYDDGWNKKKIPCGNDFQFIWEHLSSELGEYDAPTGWDLLTLADEIEKTRLTSITTYGEICAAIETHLYESTKLWPAYIHNELIGILEYRYGCAIENDTTRIKISSMANIDEWLYNAITSKRIYRLETTEEYEDQAVRIVGAYKCINDYMLQFEILEFGYDENDKPFWNSNEIFMIYMRDCKLTHRKTDELPPEYDEVTE